MLGRIAGGLAHQIRNPLGSISNAAFVLRRMLKHESNPDVASSVEIILEEAAHTNQIITQLLDNARVRPSLPQPIRARELLDQAVHQKTIPEHIDVVWQIPEELPDALVDVDQSLTALGHILNNAIEAMPDGGTLTLRGSEKEATLVIEIEDTGSGIPEEVRDRLFEPLVTTKPSGIGLGLTTSRNLIETQGGTISWQSLERGTRMGVELPKRMDAGREEAGRDEAGRVGGRSD
jgi:signal transduction histidine kinase